MIEVIVWELASFWLICKSFLLEHLLITKRQFIHLCHLESFEKSVFVVS